MDQDAERNVAAYRRMIEAFNKNDLAAVSEIMADDVVYTIPGRSPLAGTTQSLAAHLRVLGRARELSGNTLRLEPNTLAASDERLFVWGRICATRLGRSLDAEHCVTFRFSRGKVVEGRTLPVDLYAFDAFWIHHEG